MAKRQFRGWMAATQNMAYGGAGLLALLVGPAVLQVRSVTMYGSLSNFDVINDTAQDAAWF